MKIARPKLPMMMMLSTIPASGRAAGVASLELVVLFGVLRGYSLV